MPVQDVYSSNALARPMSVQDYDNANMLAQQHRQSLQQGALAMQQTQAAMQEKQSILAQREGLRGALQTGEYNLADPTHQAKLAAQFPDAAPAFLDSVQKSQTSNAAAAKDRAQAAHATAQTAGAITDDSIKKAEFMVRTLPSVTNPTQLAQWYAGGIRNQFISPKDAQEEFQTIPITDPEAMKAWIANKMQEGVSVVDKMKMKQAADIAKASNDTSRANTDAHVKAQLQAAGIAAGTSRANTRDNIAKDYTLAGRNPDGTMATPAVDGSGQLDTTKIAPADLAAAYRYKTDGTLPPNMGRGTQGAAEALRIRTIAASLDAQGGGSPEDARIRQLALKGDVTAINQIRKREVAVGANVKNFDFNADQALQLSAKVDRTGVPIANAWINAGRRSVTGNPELSAFDVAVKTTVNEFAQIVSGTTAGATTEGEKKKAEALLNSAQTPQQLSAVINQMKIESQNRMRSFADQRAESMPTNGAKPAAPKVSAASGVPPDIAAILQKHGAK